MKIKLVFIFLLVSNWVFGQQVGIGQWQVYLPFFNASSVDINEEEAFCATSGGLFTVDKNTKEVQKFSVLDGFASSDIKLVKWNTSTKQLFIVYQNSNIDVLDEGKLHNLPEIFNRNNLGRKNINAVFFKQEIAYLSTAFGIVVYNLARKEVRDTYFFTENGAPLEVFESVILGDKIFAATSSGIYEANANDLLIDFSRWRKHASNQLYPGGICRSVVDFNGKLYGLFNSQIYVFENNQWMMTSIFGVDVAKLKVVNNKFITIAPFRVIVYDSQFNQLRNIQNTNVFNNVKDVALLGEEVLIADNKIGLVGFKPDASFVNYTPAGPQIKIVKDLSSLNQQLVIAPGGFSDTYSPLFQNLGFTEFKRGEWKNYNEQTSPFLSPIRDITVIHPSATKTYLGSFVNGLLVKEGEDFKLFNQQNSSLQTTLGDAATIRVSGIAEDQRGNIWVSQFGVSSPLSVLKKDGTWQAFSFQDVLPGSFIEAKGLLVDDASQKWLMIRNRGLLIFNDSQAKILGFGANLLPGGDVLSIKKDLKGALWVGTDRGIAFIESPEDAFSNVEVEIPTLTENGFIRPVLSQEQINCIAIDGANRKWIGTNNGVWLFDEALRKQVLNFNTSNSPLISNRILDIEVEAQSGEVFIATEGGLMSYRGDATAASSKLSEITVFPNPVRPGYTGLIAVKGLTEQARVKITDISGNLVYQTVAEGGLATWDGRTFNGDAVSSGVYLILIVAEDGGDTAISKLMIVR
ncbi:type IX secretion system anionic LPS delivery protein PorZ [Pedobacter puniceum]|uniref:T9SS type A sorting domain-containing protein n=1 Tax=Pedobacter puniceum TaxID=2666136 RepID=A0A7K0FPI9_9SPHI|nr:T9SS type A sorting domain-containing protein [Pedobacter puniceum]MRX47876.1 T9SS type A sorting domain-containing protein [Pedobacter puniceum]